MNKHKRILICQQRQLGDVLLATPALALIKKHFPDSIIHFLTEKKCTPILENNPYIDTIVCIDKEVQSNIFKQINFCLRTAKNNYDLIISFQNLPRCLMVTFFSPAREKLGMNSKWYKNIFYTEVSDTPSSYSAAKKIDILKPLEIEWDGNIHLEWYTTAQELEEAHNILLAKNFTDKHTLISLDITHKDDKRRYPAKYYAQLMNMLVAANPEENFMFLLLRGENEDEQLMPFMNACNHKELIILPDSVPNLRISAALMQHASFHIGNCSFPRHLAAALDIPSFTIIGTSDDSWAFPSDKHTCISRNMPCQPCAYENCNKVACLSGFQPELIFPTLQEAIKNNLD